MEIFKGRDGKEIFIHGAGDIDTRIIDIRIEKDPVYKVVLRDLTPEDIKYPQERKSELEENDRSNDDPKLSS